MLENVDLKIFFILHLISLGVILKLINLLFPFIFEFTLLSIGNLVILLAVTKFTFQFTRKRFFNENLPIGNKAIFITGCDSGFGHLLAMHMDSKGFHVFAGCLFPSGKGANELISYCSNSLKVVELDVTNNESVEKAFEFVKSQLDNSGLWAVVNNAGVGKGSAFEFTPLEHFQTCMEVNCFGLVRVTKTFLPLLKQSRGRIINVTSVAGRVGVLRMIAYTASKFAAAGFSDSLRHELNIWGIQVISIQPNSFRTPLLNTKNQTKDLMEFDDPEIMEDYGEEYLKALIMSVEDYSKTASQEFYRVIRDLESAIRLKYPRTVYMPCGEYEKQILTSICLALPPSLQTVFINFVNPKLPKPLKA